MRIGIDLGGTKIEVLALDDVEFPLQSEALLLWHEQQRLWPVLKRAA